MSDPNDTKLLVFDYPRTQIYTSTHPTQPAVKRTMSSAAGGGGPLPVPTTEKILSISDLKAAADNRLPALARDFYNAGSTDERTLRANERALSRFHLRSRVLVDVRGLDTSASVLGRAVRFPLGCAPAGIQGMACGEGEVATSRASARMGCLMGISSFASRSIAEVVGAARDEGLKREGDSVAWDRGHPGHVIQLYPMRDRALQERILRRAEEEGCLAVFLTGDSPVLGVRYNEWRNDFRTPDGIGFPVMEAESKDIRTMKHDEKFKQFNDDGACWETEIRWLRERTKMKIFVKGVLCAEDVELAVKWGADGVIVSNHGGRQLDGVPATIDALEECIEAAEGTHLEVHVDGGFRRGADIFVALALGAKCVWVGRPVLWALAYKGQEGVERMLEIMHEDFRRCMALCGCVKVGDIHRGCLARMGPDGRLRRLKTGKSQL